MNNTPVSKTAGQVKVLKYYYAPSTYFNKYVKGSKYIQRHKVRFIFRVNNKTNTHKHKHEHLLLHPQIKLQVKQDEKIQN